MEMKEQERQTEKVKDEEKWEEGVASNGAEKRDDKEKKVKED